MRVDRLLSNLKYGSRKDVQGMIRDGFLTINDNIVTNCKYELKKDDKIVFDNNLVFFKEEINLMLNKPIDYLSANVDNIHKTVIELIKPPYDRYDFHICGRLDLDSEGLLLLSTSGKFSHIVTSPKSNISKLYEVILDKDCDISLANTLLEPHLLKDGSGEIYTSKALSVKKIKSNVYQVELNMGKYHQVKKMFKSIGFEVLNLKRLKIGKLMLDPNLKPGEYKEVSREDII